MTREEAIKWLEAGLRVWERECKSKHAVKDALKMAIKALEQEPCGDAVSRQAAIEAIEQHKTAVLGENKYDEGIALGYAAAHRHLVDIVKQLPSVQPEKRTQERTETHACDCISRQAVNKLIDELARAISDERGCMTTRGRDTATIMQDILDLPPAVTEKTAYWILLDECSNSGYYCSECHKKVVKEGWSNTVKKIKFCPNCGAKIVESEDEE